LGSAAEREGPGAEAPVEDGAWGHKGSSGQPETAKNSIRQ
jgi:hypothetical protein